MVKGRGQRLGSSGGGRVIKIEGGVIRGSDQVDKLDRVVMCSGGGVI